MRAQASPAGCRSRLMKSSMIASIAAASAAGGDALQRLSLPKSSEFVTNGRGQRIHVRTQLAAQETCKEAPKGIVVYLHGLHSHGSRIICSALAAELNAIGFHFAALDFHGHGHSDGQPGVVASHSDLIDDAHSLLAALYRGPSAAAPCPAHCLHAPPLPASCPFFLLGSSMGGAVALVLANMCCSTVPPASPHPYSSACCGAILLAPAIRIKLPWFAPAFILSPFKAALRWLVLPLSPSSVLPGSFKKASAPEHPIWDTEEYIAYVDADPATYHGDLHLSTLCSIIDLSHAALDAASALQHHSLRVLAFMDPADAVTDFSGVQALCSTAAAACDGRVTVVEMPGAKHDVLSNRADAVLQRMAAWLTPAACQAAGAAPQ